MEMTRVTRQDIYELRDSMQRFCFQYGDFTLSSGLKSKYYYNGKRAVLRPGVARLIGRVVFQLVEDAGAEAVGGPEIGSIPIAQSVGAASLEGGREVPAFIVRKEAKQHGTREQVAEAAPDQGEHLLTQGRKVAIVDDVITTGGSIEKAIEVVEALGCQVVLVVALVERHEGGGQGLRDRGYNFRRLFYTDEEGHLSIDEALLLGAPETAREGALRG
jgi:orotate phosphoribosyltransferase